MILRSWPVRPINPLFTIPRFNAQTGGWPPRCYSPTSHQLSLPRPLVALSRSLEADDGKTAGLLRQPQANATFSRDAVDWTQRQDQMTTDVCRVTRKSNQSTIAHQSNRWLVLGVPGREGRLGRNQKLSLSRKRSLSEIARLRTIFPAIKIAGFAFRSAFVEGLSTTRCITR
jgi:hypothetical protein